MLQLSVSQSSSRKEVSLLIKITEQVTAHCPALIGSNKIREINVKQNETLQIIWSKEPNEFEETIFNQIWENLGMGYENVNHALIIIEY